MTGRKVHVQASLPDGTPIAGWTTDDAGTHTPDPEVGMSSQTQRDLLEVGLLTHTEAEAPMTDIGALLRAIVRLVSTVSDLEKEVREIRNKI